MKHQWLQDAETLEAIAERLAEQPAAPNQSAAASLRLVAQDMRAALVAAAAAEPAPAPAADARAANLAARAAALEALLAEPAAAGGEAAEVS
jgi:hypothetical protein